MDAAGEAFRAWRDHRGSGQEEPTKILQAAVDFIERHGGSRFEPIDGAEHPAIRDRAGWREGSTYFFTAGGLREAVAGFDLKAATTVLVDKGALPPPGPDGKTAAAKTIQGRKVRVYAVDAERLGACSDGH